MAYHCPSCKTAVQLRRYVLQEVKVTSGKGSPLISKVVFSRRKVRKNALVHRGERSASKYIEEQGILKLADNPPMLSQSAQSVYDMNGRWWLAHTKARFEKAFAWDLFSRGIGYFLPMLERVRFSGGRKRRTMLPLFTSYVFFNGSEEDRVEALATNRLCQIIKVVAQKTLVRELSMIQRAVQGTVSLDLYPFAAQGERCRIISGPFADLEGTVVERSRTARLVLAVDMLGQGVVMEIDADLLEPVK